MSDVSPILSFVAAALTVLIPAAFVLMMPPVNQFGAARWSFGLSGIGLLAVVALGLVSMGSPLIVTIIGAVAAAAFVGILLKTAFGWVSTAEQKAASGSAGHRTRHPALIASQMEHIRELDGFIARKDEIALRRAFDLHFLLEANIAYHASEANPELADDERVRSLLDRAGSGRMLLAPEYSRIETDENGVHRFETIEGKLASLLLSDTYWAAREHVRSLAASAQLPHLIAAAVEDFADAVDRNVSLILTVLNEAHERDPHCIVEAVNTESGAHANLNTTYNRRIEPLRPLAERVTDAIRAHLSVT